MKSIRSFTRNKSTCHRILLFAPLLLILSSFVRPAMAEDLFVPEGTGGVSGASMPPLHMLAYDDGAPDRGGIQQETGDAVALRVTPPAYPFLVQRISVNIVHLGSNPEDMLEIQIYAEENGSPGELLLEHVHLSGTGNRFEENLWVDVDVSAYGISIEEGSFYVALEWKTPYSPGLGIDTSDPNELRTWVREAGDWYPLHEIYPWAYDDQAMIRVFGSQVPPGSPLFLQSLFYDDGTAERGGIQQVVGDAVALRMSPSIHPFYLQRVAVDIVNFGGDPTDELELRIYDDNNGVPGDLLLGGLRISGEPVEFYYNFWIDVDVSPYDIIIDEGDFYVSVVWKTPSSPGLGIDASDPNELRTWVCEGNVWSLLANKYPWAQEDQAMIRVLGNLYSPVLLDGLAYDDGYPEKGGIQQIVGDMVALQLTPATYPFYLKTAAVNIANYGGDATDELELRVYADNNGAPGALLASGLKIIAPPIPFGTNIWVQVDLSSLGIVVPKGHVYLAVVWKTPWSPGLGIDQSPPNELRTWVRESGRWNLLKDAYPWAQSDQAMIRALGTTADTLAAIIPISPANGAVIGSPPTFTWSAVGGAKNVFAVDLSNSSTFASYWSTYESLGQKITGTSWTIPRSLWRKGKSGEKVYWRVRGRDLDHKPVMTITSDEARYFMKK